MKMKTWKKRIAVIISFIMIATLCGMFPQKVKAAEKVRFTVNVSKSELVKGDTVTYTVTMSQNVTGTGLDLEFIYDDSMLELQEAVKGEVFNGATVSDLNDTLSGRIHAVAASNGALSDGTVFTATFKVNDTAQGELNTGIERIELVNDGYEEVGYEIENHKASIKENVVPPSTQMLDTPIISNLNVNATGVVITWGKVTGAEKYCVFRKTSKSWEKIGITTETTYTDTAAKAGSSYTYTIRCISSDEKSYVSTYDTKGKTISCLPNPQITKMEVKATGVAITWGKVTGAEKYHVFRKTSKSWARVGETTGTTFIDEAAKAGSNYTYTVRCVSEDGKIYTSHYDTTGKTISYLSNPQITKLEAKATGVAVTWGKITGAEKYYVYRKTSTSWKKIGETTGTTYTDETATPGADYTYTVRCVTGDGKIYTSHYDTNGKTISYLPNPQITKLEVKATGVAVTWGKVTKAEKYYVYRKTSTSWMKVGETTGTTYTDTTAKEGSKYTYTIRCVSKDGKAYTSAYDTKGKTISYLSAPQITKLEAKATGVAITWGKVTGAEKYYVYRKTSTSWKKIGETTGTTYTDTTATPGVSYTYTIRCVSEDGTSYTSHYDTAGKTISYLPNPQITKLEAKATGVAVTWGKVTGAEKYYVFKKTDAGWKKIGETTGTTYTDTTATAESSYTYTVRCVTSDGKTYTSSYDTKGKTITR